MRYLRNLWPRNWLFEIQTTVNFLIVMFRHRQRGRKGEGEGEREGEKKREKERYARTSTTGVTPGGDSTSGLLGLRGE